VYRIKSQIDTKSDSFQANEKAFKSLLDTFRERTAATTDRENDRSVLKHKKRGKLLARERINLLVDQNTPFLELSTLAANGLYENQFPSAGIITGIGLIQGKEIYHYCQ